MSESLPAALRSTLCARSKSRRPDRSRGRRPGSRAPSRALPAPLGHVALGPLFGSILCVLDSAVPEISRFFGIVIRVFYSDHTPPHFHAAYGDEEALIEIETLGIHRGSLPRRARALVLEWAALHRDELRQDWELARSGNPPLPIEPLE